MLRDGTVPHQRAVRPEDAPLLQAFHRRQSWQTIFFRFFGAMPELSGELAGRLSQVDYENRMAIIATPGMGASEDEPIIAVARYQRTAPEVAEFAPAVEDHWQGRGIDPQLLRTLLAEYARGHGFTGFTALTALTALTAFTGFTAFTAEVMYDNDHMLAVPRHAGIPTTLRLYDGRVEGRLDISGISG